MGFRVIRLDESMCWSMPKLCKVIPAEDTAFVMQIHPKSPHGELHLMGEAYNTVHPKVLSPQYWGICITLYSMSQYV